MRKRKSAKVGFLKFDGGTLQIEKSTTDETHAAICKIKRPLQGIFEFIIKPTQLIMASTCDLLGLYVGRVREFASDDPNPVFAPFG